MDPTTPLYHIASITLILIGACFMLVSIRLSLKILPSIPRLYEKQWKFIIVLMCFFISGYLLYILIILFQLFLPAELVTGVVFLAGAVFVYLMLRLTSLSMLKLKKNEKLLQKNNELLEHRVIERTQNLKETTDKLQQEIVLRQKNHVELDAIHKDINQILDTTSTGIRKIGLDHTVLMVNKRFCELTGRSEEELLGKKCYENFIDDSCKDSSTCPLSAIKNNGHISQYEKEKKSHSGKTFTCIVTGTPTYNDAKQIVGIIEDIQDITSLKKAAEEKENLKLQVLQKSKLESVGQLAAGIAHEINTPVQYISSNLDFFKDSFQDICTMFDKFKEIADTKTTESCSVNIKTTIHENDWAFLEEEIPVALEQTKDGIERVAKIVQAMKQFSHPTSHEMVHSDINTIISNTIMISQNEWKYVAELETNLAKNLPEIPCLSDGIGQVLLNLIVNASHAIKDTLTDIAVKKGFIHITSELLNDMVLIRIKDSGKGISDNIKEKVFDPFFTTKDVGQGTGQGLSISYDVVVNKHGGKLSFESETDQGTTFNIQLPLRQRTKGTLPERR